MYLFLQHQPQALETALSIIMENILTQTVGLKDVTKYQIARGDRNCIKGFPNEWISRYFEHRGTKI